MNHRSSLGMVVPLLLLHGCGQPKDRVAGGPPSTKPAVAELGAPASAPPQVERSKAYGVFSFHTEGFTDIATTACLSLDEIAFEQEGVEATSPFRATSIANRGGPPCAEARELA